MYIAQQGIISMFRAGTIPTHLCPWQGINLCHALVLSGINHPCSNTHSGQHSKVLHPLHAESCTSLLIYWLIINEVRLWYFPLIPCYAQPVLFGPQDICFLWMHSPPSEYSVHISCFSLSIFY